jgi:hypothetical protein
MLVEPDDPTWGQFSSEVHNFTDVFRALNPSDIGYTYGHQYAPLLGRIDYIIVNDFFLDKLVNSTVGDTAHADTGSDHYCVDAWISWDGTEAVTLPVTGNIPQSSMEGETSLERSQEFQDAQLGEDKIMTTWFVIALDSLKRI